MQATEHKSTDYRTWGYGLRPTNKNQIIWQCYNFWSIFIDDFQHHPFLYQVKVLSTALFTELKMANCYDEKIHYSNLYLLFHLPGNNEVFCEIMQHMFSKEIQRYIKTLSLYHSPLRLGSLSFLHKINTLRVKFRTEIGKSISFSQRKQKAVIATIITCENNCNC